MSRSIRRIRTGYAVLQVMCWIGLTIPTLITACSTFPSNLWKNGVYGSCRPSAMPVTRPGNCRFA